MVQNEIMNGVNADHKLYYIFSTLGIESVFLFYSNVLLDVTIKDFKTVERIFNYD